ncbi:MAG: hypothetical protein HN353_10175 [Bdellovibrionales bacterium]|jgi:hypothetical protein|nr:hypothetical protein [Bdellovibrionales bacterium]MBT3527267.1 hypothetical protein [Bdellovibrionales bacterium]MBT7668472.1 hypothetical protein [Bdellovibrionales bacterium]MBT7767156.1 hypothetical protein [Bdellovibrionales bacterium]
MTRVNLAGGPQIYYISVLTLLMTLFSYGAYYFWDHGVINVSNIVAVFDSEATLEKLNGGSELKQIHTLVNSDRVRESVPLVTSLLQTSSKLNVAVIGNSQAFTQFKTDLAATRKRVDRLISYPNTASIFRVLGSKVKGFENFVVTNKWRTLTRISRRLNVRIASLLRSADQMIHYQTFKRSVATIKKDVKLMRAVTLSSILSDQEKSVITLKVDTLKTELAMLDNYLTALSSFNREFQKVNSSYLHWLKYITPLVKASVEKLEGLSHQLLISLGGFILLLFTSILGGVAVYHRTKSNLKASYEGLIVQALSDGIIAPENSFDHGLTPSFDLEINRLRDYVHKRMNFGAVFQDALPFSSIMLDSNLKVVWANPLFYESWDLKDYQFSEQTLSWDYLQRFTNLGENDPLVEALNQGVAGIYQIQVKTSLHQESYPYEMYVSPVTSQGQDRIMIFFYPLSSVEQSLANQTKSLVGPVARTLDALTNKHFDLEFMEGIKKDFEIAGISEIFNKFKVHQEMIAQQEEAQQEEHRRLLEHLQEELDRLAQAEKNLIGQFDGAQRMGEGFKSLGSEVVSLIELRQQIANLYSQSVTRMEQIMNNNSDLLLKAAELKCCLNDGQRSVESVIAVKDKFKGMRLRIDDFKYRINQTLDQILLLQKSDQLDSFKMEQAFERVKIEIKEFEKVLQGFNQVVTSLDVSLSKMEMVVGEGDKIVIDQTKEQTERLSGQVTQDMGSYRELKKGMPQQDELLIEIIKQVYGDYQQGVKQLKELSLTVEGRREIDLDLTMPPHLSAPSDPEVVNSLQ